MKNLFILFCLSLSLASCGGKCRYNGYLPENNPLVVPDDLKQKPAEK